MSTRIAHSLTEPSKFRVPVKKNRGVIRVVIVEDKVEPVILYKRNKVK